MLGMSKAEKNTYNDVDNRKLVAAYETAYGQYCEAQDRYDRLVQAYSVLKGFLSGKDKEERKATLPNTEKIMRRMIEDAAEEQAHIADFARDCVKHLHSLAYEA